ncbi:MAG: tetratricopeptide repeat protein [Lachnospiraceae bacterium]|nr:tetratricopeptide repeat protein [Lachnospiraceae bacterium]
MRKNISKWWLAGTMAMFLTGCTFSQEQENNNVALGMNAIEQQAYDTAVEYFNGSIAEGKNLELSYRGLGMAYMNQGDYQQARDAFIQALQSASGGVGKLEVDISCYLASAYYHQGDYQNALETYNNVLELEKKNGDLFYLRGVVNLSAGNQEAALGDFDKSISLDSKNYDRYINIYQELKQAGDTEKALSYLSQCESLLTNKQQYEKGRILYYMEDYNGAVSALESLSQAGDNKATLYLGKAYEALGDMNYAASLYETYLTKDENNGEVYNQLGLCKLSMGAYEEALSCFQKGIQTGDVSVMQELLFNEASAYEYVSDFSTAKTKFSEYLAKYPKDTNAMREYEFLKSR